MHYDAAPTTVGDVVATTATDGWIVTQHGKILAEEYYGGMTADTSHLLMSVSKSLVGTVIGHCTPRVCWTWMHR